MWTKRDAIMWSMCATKSTQKAHVSRSSFHIVRISLREINRPSLAKLYELKDPPRSLPGSHRCAVFKHNHAEIDAAWSRQIETVAVRKTSSGPTDRCPTIVSVTRHANTGSLSFPSSFFPRSYLPWDIVSFVLSIILFLSLVSASRVGSEAPLFFSSLFSSRLISRCLRTLKLALHGGLVGNWTHI